MWEFDSLIPNQENRSLNWLRYFRGIAQLVARLVRDEEAVGSNPAAPTKKNQYTFVYWFFFVSARDLNRAAVRSTANKAIVWLCLARGSHRLGMSNRVHAANTFVYWFFFVSARDLQQRRPLPAAETGRSCWGRVLIFQSPVKGLRKNQQTQPVGRRRSDDVTGSTG